MCLACALGLRTPLTLVYGITKLATDFTGQLMSDWRVRMFRTILFFIPRANPDNERLYPQVTAWALELDDDGWPQREVGLDVSGNPLFCAPDARNTGFWPDMAIRQFSVSELEYLSEEKFNELWSATETGA